MTKFNPENKEKLTYGEILDLAMEITDPQDAQQYLTEYAKHIQKYLDEEPNAEDMTAEEIAKSNIAYYAGYYGNDTRKRVEELFTCAHPIFGSIEENGVPTPRQAFQMGQDRSEENKQK